MEPHVSFLASWAAVAVSDPIGVVPGYSLCESEARSRTVTYGRLGWRSLFLGCRWCRCKECCAKTSSAGIWLKKYIAACFQLFELHSSHHHHLHLFFLIRLSHIFLSYPSNTTTSTNLRLFCSDHSTPLLLFLLFNSFHHVDHW
jgi:hypothetical protein